MLVIASELSNPTTTPTGVTLRCVVSQTPHLDGRENRKKNMKPPPEVPCITHVPSTRGAPIASPLILHKPHATINPPPQGRGILGALTISLAALCDIARSVAFQPPAYIPIVGQLGTVSLMPLPEDELSLYFRKHPAQVAS